MRGEDLRCLMTLPSPEGSPPHARGRLSSLAEDSIRRGITPACAGKTSPSRAAGKSLWDHPRMRGEDLPAGAQAGYRQGSPPHARGRPDAPAWDRVDDRITPACAGKTEKYARYWFAHRDHPRMRGEDLSHPVSGEDSPGSPPHARGRRFCRIGA